jgi:DNA-binding NarL/FixJ family response regulator
MKNSSVQVFENFAKAQASPKRIRVVVSDDNFIVTTGLVRALAPLPDIEVTGAGLTHAEVAQQLLNKQPIKVVIFSCYQLQAYHLEIIRSLLKVQPSLAILVITWEETPQVRREALEAGAKGYLVHGQFSLSELVFAVRSISEGGTELLTRREQTILELMQAGQSNQQIAENLGIEEKTVKNHINRLYSKLHLHNRCEAIILGNLTTPR